MIKIDKSVPVPPESNGGRKPTYPWAEMQVGDSFFVPTTNHNSVNITYTKKHMPGSTWTRRTVTAHLDGLRLSGPAADTRTAIALLTKRDNVVRLPVRARLVGSEWTRWEGVGS